MATMPFTAALARNPPLPEPGQRKLRLFDTAMAGFCLEVWPSGAATYWFRYRDARGRSREVKLGRTADVTLDQARRKAKELRASVALGGDPKAEREKAKGTPTFGAFTAERYLPYARERLRSWKDQDAMLRLRLLPRWKSRALNEVRPDDVVKLIADLRKAGLANASVNRHIALVRRVFNLAIQWEVAEMKNPAKHVGMLRETHREAFLSPDELRRLFQALDAEPNRTIAAAIALLALTGARCGEARNMRWADVDIERQTWRVQRSKSGKTRHIPLSRAAIGVLLDQHRRSGDNTFVFPGRSGEKPLNFIRKAWLRVRAAAGLKADVRIHDLRHTFASTLVNNGRPIYEVAQILGHTQLSTTQRYSHFDNARLVESANIAGEIVAAV